MCSMQNSLKGCSAQTRQFNKRRGRQIPALVADSMSPPPDLGGDCFIGATLSAPLFERGTALSTFLSGLSRQLFPDISNRGRHTYLLAVASRA